MPDLRVQLKKSEAPAQYATEMQNAVKDMPWAITVPVMATALWGLHTCQAPVMARLGKV